MAWHDDVMRTTVNIAEHLLLEAKRLAATRRTSLAKIVEDSLRKYLADCRVEEQRGRGTWEIPSIDAGEAAPNVDLNDTSALWEL